MRFWNYQACDKDVTCFVDFVSQFKRKTFNKGLYFSYYHIEECSKLTILKAEKIHKYYGNKFNRQEVLKGIDLAIEEGEFVSIMGASGSGKTTLLNVLSSIDKLTSGALQIEDQDMTKLKEKQLAIFRKQHLGFIFQDYHLLDTLTVKENILLPLSIAGLSKKQAQLKFDTLADQLGLKEIANHYPNQISGGQKQRTSAARAFIHQPSIIFADEPTGALDSKAAADLLNLLSDLNQQRKATIVMVTHDMTAASFSKRVVFIKDGQVYTQLNKGDQNRQRFYQDIMKTQAVLSGVPHEH